MSRSASNIGIAQCTLGCSDIHHLLGLQPAEPCSSSLCLLSPAHDVCVSGCAILPTPHTCLSSPCLQALGRRIPFTFLDDIKEKFLAAYGPEAAQHAVAYEYNTEFSSILQQRMRYFVSDPNADTINRVRGGVAEVKDIMVENIEKVCMLLAQH